MLDGNLQGLLEQASETGARRALAQLGLDDASAAKDALEASVPGMVDLMAVFILKTLLLPLLFLYGLKRAFSVLWGWRGASLKPATA